MILIEQNFQSEVLHEGEGPKKKTYLMGVMAEAEKKNRNGRIYDAGEMRLAESKINEAAESGTHILGHLDHPNTLEIQLENVSHRLIHAQMKNNQLVCKAEILENHPKGAIAKSLIDHGVKLGVSTRGSGSVNESTGRVSKYNFVTVDLVANPSCQSAYPESIQEQLMMSKNGNHIIDLSENLNHDPIAQKYFEIEMRKFIESLHSK